MVVYIMPITARRFSVKLFQAEIESFEDAVILFDIGMMQCTNELKGLGA
jgi:hypothetical protein